MSIRITSEDATNWLANKYLAYQEPQATDARKAQILPQMKYNVLVDLHNASTVLLVAAVASAVIFAFSAAVTFGTLGYLVRLASQRELTKFMLPVEPQPEPAAPEEGVAGRLRRVVDRVRQQSIMNRAYVLVGAVSPKEKEENIFEHVRVAKPENWTREYAQVMDLDFWLNKVPLAPAQA